MKIFTIVAVFLATTTLVQADQAPPNFISPNAPNYFDFSFTFVNVGNDNATVTGVVRGLRRNGTSAAYSVEITDTTGNYGVGQYVGSPIQNEWTLVNGGIEDISFISFGAGNSAPAVTDHSLIIRSDVGPLEPYGAGLSSAPNGAGIPSDMATSLTFEVIRGYEYLPPNFGIAVPSGASNLTGNGGSIVAPALDLQLDRPRLPLQ